MLVQHGSGADPNISLNDTVRSYLNIIRENGGGMHECSGMNFGHPNSSAELRRAWIMVPSEEVYKNLSENLHNHFEDLGSHPALQGHQI